MPTLSNNAADAFQEIKEAVAVHIANTPNSGNVMRRIRYADNINQWLAIAAVDDPEKGEVVRAVFVYIAGFTSVKSEARQRRITLTLSIEIIQQFIDGTDSDNSTIDYERLLGNLEEAFKSDTALGFTDAASQDVENTPFSAEVGENEGKPVYVDGVLAHRVVGGIQAIFRLCNY